jgi:hypothetical protein
MAWVAIVLGFVAYWFVTVPVLLLAFGIGCFARFRLARFATAAIGTVGLLLLALTLLIGYLLGPQYTPCSL